MRIYELDRAKALAVVVGTETLREKFDSYVWESENDHIQDKLSCFEDGVIDYEYGVCSYSHVEMKDTWGTLRGIEESIKSFGATTKVEKLARQARRLAYSNLFEWTVEKLLNAWFESEVLDAIEYVEDVGYSLYCEDADKVDELAGDYFDCFLDNGCLDNYDYDEDDGRVYRCAYAVA